MDIEINDYEILDRANQFRDAADILKQSNKLIPTELNACLACELYLKYLVNFEKDGIQTKTKKQLVAGHDLKELYDKCDDSIKILIKEKMDDDFETHLEKVKLNFAVIRYDYEHEKVVYSPAFVIRFMEILSEICYCRQNHYV
ncbi:MAG: hypothetical protein K1W35_11945 [Lachnospiraceae bacterium]